MNEVVSGCHYVTSIFMIHVGRAVLLQLFVCLKLVWNVKGMEGSDRDVCTFYETGQEFDSTD
jgi:hypothetical protein